MSLDVEQAIQEKVRVLSPEKQQKVLDLVESLSQETTQKTLWENWMND